MKMPYNEGLVSTVTIPQLETFEAGELFAKTLLFSTPPDAGISI
jgi:predicted alternative tryptophan synthase beta-subunit